MLPTRTQAAVLLDCQAPLSLLELDLPALKPGQVLVEVAFSGLCGTQLLEVRGRKGPDRFLPHTLGHEGSGLVLAVGPDVTKVSSGEAVVLSWLKGSGAEVPSTTYGGPSGPVNSGAISTFMRHAIVSENRVTPVPTGLSLRDAALLGCAIPTGAGVVLNTLDAQPGQGLAIFGMGGIGLSALLGAVARGLHPVIAVDVHEAKLARALQLGATHAIHGGREAVVERVQAITGGHGVDFALEAAGRPETMDAAFRSVRPGGGICVLAGNLAAGERMQLDPMDLLRGRCLRGTWGGESQLDRDVPRYARLVAEGRMQPGSLVTHTFGLEDINRAFTVLERGEAGRILLDLSLPKGSHPLAGSSTQDRA